MRAIDADKLHDVLHNIWLHLEETGTVMSGPMSNLFEVFMQIVEVQPDVDLEMISGTWGGKAK